MKRPNTPSSSITKHRILRSLRSSVRLLVLIIVAISVEASARPSLTISFSNGASVIFHSARDRFNPVGIFPGEAVDIDLAVSPSLAGTHLYLEALDGGAVTQDVVIAADGTAEMTFQAGMQVGLYRLMAVARGKTAMLQFWVLDLQHPENNPPVRQRTSDGN